MGMIREAAFAMSAAPILDPSREEQPPSTLDGLLVNVSRKRLPDARLRGKTGPNTRMLPLRLNIRTHHPRSNPGYLIPTLSLV